MKNKINTLLIHFVQPPRAVISRNGNKSTSWRQSSLELSRVFHVPKVRFSDWFSRPQINILAFELGIGSRGEDVF